MTEIDRWIDLHEAELHELAEREDAAFVVTGNRDSVHSRSYCSAGRLTI
jgi:hypothetical protein